MTLYSYWRSTTSYRVRIAMHLKGLAFDIHPVDLLKDAQRDPSYTALNPGAGVPALALEDGTVLTQSMAILDYLDTAHPTPPLLPPNPVAAAQVRAAALTMACDVHPVNNLRVTQRLQAMGHDKDTVLNWMHHWMIQGLAAFDALLPDGPVFAFGDTPGLADICLVAQLYNAHRWGVDMTALPRLTEIETRCAALPAFVAAHPNAQPDAEITS
ncbi:maleylacetoacetate isomerase [Actibacterium mucosum KCTC 23349]|uniref:Maleylacetoacetate isomerase n=1 Tax=Actibacterium mucosum KCTC 23349 TaxID=1454373 RepID=A0A037ZKK7_9RHOB|nr:maleylacetoacetate isomerase [Actibacterium mucosum]KAJ56087.1 maleylacetoacetate isomerase [Actibacterium mucosum KCTC 23349]